MESDSSISQNPSRKSFIDLRYGLINI